MGDCFSENPENIRDSLTRHPAGLAAKGWNPGRYPVDQPKYIEVSTYLGRPGGISRRVDQRSADCVEFAENPDKYLRPADPPSRRFCGDGARLRNIRARPTEIRRDRHLLAAADRNSEPPLSAAECGVSSGNPEKIRCSMALNPAGSSAKGRDSGIFPPDRPRFSEISKFLGRSGAISNLMDQLSVLLNYMESLGNLRGTRIRRPAGYSAQGRDSSKFPPCRQRFGEIATHTGRSGAISHLVDQWPIG